MASAIEASRGRALGRSSEAALFALLCLGVWLNAADTMVTATIMPSVAVEIGGYAYFAWASAGYMLGSIIASASAGRMSQRLGLRIALMLSALAYAGGCVISATAANIALFLFGRLLQGFGAGWIVGLCYVTIRQYMPERLWARVFASLAAVWGVATVLGPLVGGLFASMGLWRGAFWAFGVQAAAFAVAAPLLLSSKGQNEVRTAIEGGAEAAAGFAFAQLAMLSGAILLIAVAGVLGRPLVSAIMVATGLGTIALMLRFDDQAQVRLFPRGAGDLGAVAGSGFAMMFCLSAAAMGFSVYGPALLQAMDRISPLAAGYVIASESVGWVICAFLVAGLPTRRQSSAIRAGGAVVLVGVIGVALAMPTGSILLVSAAGVALGSGFGLSWAFTSRRVLSSLPESEAALGASALPTMQLAGNATGAAVVGVIANMVGFSKAITAATAHERSFWLFAAFVPVAAFGCFAAMRLSRYGADHTDCPGRVDARV